MIVTHNMQQAAARVAVLRVLPRGRERAGHRRRAGPDREDVLPARRPAHARLRDRDGSDDAPTTCSLALGVARAWSSSRSSCRSRRGAAHADVSIDGAGSTWAQIALDQWRADVARQGLSVNYQGVGSTSGRVFYYQDQVDFAASEIPFTPAYRDATGTVITNEVALAAHRPYAYMPDVAGGTSFMYHLDDQRPARHEPAPLARRRSRRSSPASSRTGTTPRSSPTTRSCSCRTLPIRPIVRSDGSGTTAQFTAFMASQTPASGTRSAQRVGVQRQPVPVGVAVARHQRDRRSSSPTASPTTSPRRTTTARSRTWSTATRKQRGFPVASVLNKAGYYTQPTPGNVAIALQGATLNADLTQNLGGVYNNPDPRTYPVSSYSYLIVPTTTAAPFTAAKGTTLSKFILYFVCAGQQKAAQLGYSPLPEEPRAGRVQRRCARSPATSTRRRSTSATTRRSRETFIDRRRATAAPERQAGRDPTTTTQPATERPVGSPADTGNGTPGTGQRRTAAERQHEQPVPDDDHDQAERDDHHVDDDHHRPRTEGDDDDHESRRGRMAVGVNGDRSEWDTTTARAQEHLADQTRASGPITIPRPKRDPLSVLLYVLRWRLPARGRVRPARARALP